MADSEQILQLGIEEARNGNREEARNLFDLLTRQEPDNAQAWLWLAGVADGPEQRREALQKVLDLDPNNEMARKGLQAMGALPSEAAVGAPVATAAPVSAPVAASRDMTDEERYAAELDSAFDDYDSVPRNDPPVRRAEAADFIDDTATATGPAARSTSSRSSTSTGRSTGRRPTVAVQRDDDDDDLPPRRGPSSLLWLLLGLIGLVVVGFLLLQIFNPGGGGTPTPTDVATVPTTLPTSDTGTTEPTVDPSAPQPTVDPSAPQPTVDPSAPQPTVDPSAPQPTVDPSAPQPTVDPSAPQPTAAAPTPGTAGPPPEQANPAPVDVGTTLQSNGWGYSFPQANYALVLGNQVAGFTAQGTYLHVLVYVSNNSGTNQAVPADFFVLKDGQGRVYSPLVDVSNAAVQRGVNADLALGDAIPANGAVTSVYLVFDVQPGASDLTLFARSNPAQGWRITPDRAP